MKKPAIHRAILQHAHVAGVAVRQDRFRAVLADDGLEFRGNRGQRFVPRDRRELAFALCTNALERCLDARRVVGPQRIFRDLGAKHARRHAVTRRAFDFNQFATSNVIFQRAGVRTIVRACALDDAGRFSGAHSAVIALDADTKAIGFASLRETSRCIAASISGSTSNAVSPPSNDGGSSPSRAASP